MFGGLANLVWRRTLPWLLLGLTLTLLGGYAAYYQIASVNSVLAAQSINVKPTVCPDLLNCSQHVDTYFAFLGRVGRWLLAQGEASISFAVLTLLILLVGLISFISNVPRPVHTLRAAKRLRRRAEDNPWQTRRRRPVPLPATYGRFWAARSQIKDLIKSRRGQAGRSLFLGTWGGAALHIYPGWDGKPELDHTLLVSPPGGGKGMLIKTNLLAYRGSALVADPKGEFYRDVAGYLQRQGHRLIVLGVEGQGHRFDPFAEFEGVLGLQAAAHLLVGSTENAREPIFAERAAIAVHAGLLGARKQGRAGLPYLAEISARGLRSYLEALHALDDPTISRKINAFLSEPPEELEWDDVKRDRFIQSCWGHFSTRLEPLFAPTILAATNGSDVLAADLREHPTTVFLQFPKETIEATLPLFQLISEALIRGLTKQGQDSPAYLAQPVLWICDEAHVLVPPRLPEHLNTLRGYGVAAMVVLQGRAQLRRLYGDKGAETVEMGCATQLYYRPADLETPQHISRRAGLMPFPQESTSQQDGDQRVNVNLGTRPLIRPEEVLEMGDEQVILFPRGRPPVAAKRLWPTDLGWGQAAFTQMQTGQGSRLVPKYAAPNLSRLDVSTLELPKSSVFHVQQGSEITILESERRSASALVVSNRRKGGEVRDLP